MTEAASTVGAVDPSAVLIDPSADALPERAVLVVAEEGVTTSDRRGARPGSLGWRDGPLSLTLDHGDSKDIVGRIDRFDRVDDVEGLLPSNYVDRVNGSGRYVVGLATFDLATDLGADAARKVRDLFLRGVSMEVGDETIEMEWEQGCDPDAEMCEGVEWLASAEIGAVSLVTFPAFASGEAIVDEDPAVEVIPPADDVSRETLPLPPALVAALALPPAEWFEDPGLEQPTGIQIDDDGRLFGHLAVWGVEHIGLRGRYAQPSPSGYHYFRTGQRMTSEGLVDVGVLTMDTGHENDLYASMAQAVSHYDDTGSQFATVNIGEDSHGIWVAGALLSDITAEQLDRARAAGRLSGDWRPVGRDLELCAALVVNVPGFGIPPTRLALAAGGQRLALVAAPGPCMGVQDHSEGVVFVAELERPDDWPGIDYPHVTLLYLGKVGDDAMPTERDAVMALHGLTLDGPPDAAIGGFDLFGPDDDKVLVATISPTEGLAALRAQLEGLGMVNGSQFTDYRPHLTLGPAETSPPEDRVGEPVPLGGVGLRYGTASHSRMFATPEAPDAPLDGPEAAVEPEDEGQAPPTVEELAGKLDAADERVGLLESRVDELEAVVATLGLPAQAVEALVSALGVRFAAVRSHDTPTTDTAWDGPAAEARVRTGETPDYYRRIYAWQDDEGDPAVKSSWKFIHHEGSGDGTPGAANLTACSTGIGVLNGARGGTAIPDGDLQGVYDHLARHLRDGGLEPPPATFSMRTPLV